jgi:hypothetical protein
MDKKYLYLDDMRIPVDNKWLVAKDYDEFVKFIEQYGLDSFELISLDHDLGMSAMREWYRMKEIDEDNVINYDNIHEKTGYDAAKYLVGLSLSKDIPLPLIYVHSANVVGSENIIYYINNYLKHCGLKQTFNCPSGF